MGQETEAASFEILNDKVGLLPGTYGGYMVYSVVTLQGHERRSLVRAMIPVTREILIASGHDVANKNFVMSEINVLPDIHAGNVKRIT
jgi:hypothetical protein